jgi:hypothetical protein
MRTDILLAIAFPLVALIPSVAAADDLQANADDPGKITRIKKGVWEIDAAALGILTFNKDGDAQSTRVSGDTTVTVQRFIRDNVSVGAAILVSYVNDADTSAIQFGGALVSTLHLRLGQGAFLRPQLALGALVSKREIPMAGAPNIVEEVDQIAGVARIRMPLAYFVSRRWVLEAGPQINVSVGTYQPGGQERRTFVQIAGGFSIGAGVAF